MKQVERSFISPPPRTEPLKTLNSVSSTTAFDTEFMNSSLVHPTSSDCRIPRRNENSKNDTNATSAPRIPSTVVRAYRRGSCHRAGCHSRAGRKQHALESRGLCQADRNPLRTAFCFQNSWSSHEHTRAIPSQSNAKLPY
jgi:hypothetical protein